MLVGEMGASDKYQTYDLKASVIEDVYVPGADGAIAISQQEYKRQSSLRETNYIVLRTPLESNKVLS